MKFRQFNLCLQALLVGAGMVLGSGSATAAVVPVTADIATSTTWTAANTYDLTKQIYVLPGASLTIEAGTVIASTAGVGGSLAVCRGAQIFVQGTAEKPVIMTSTADVATWVGGDPKTGTWRASANEWGNLTLMGSGYISEDATTTNVASPNAANYAYMEGLVASGPGDTKTQYGGGDDNDDSGSISYLSLRYGGKVIALTNELNGLSLGGIGRGTDIHHVEIMNNVDDGVEIWGGAVNLKYISIWNVGDDSFDVDQGWRGKAQFVLIVQGYSLDAKQGSGVGDNCFETDGAEDSDWQPVTTATIYNATVIGQPYSGGGDGLTAWRDNARVQYHNCIFMDCGEKVVRFDNDDGDGASGYGHNNTLSWVNTWTTPYTTTSTVNAPANPGQFYQSQTMGNLAMITDSVFYNNTNSSAYTEADARGVFAAANNNVKEPTTMPVQTLNRQTPILLFGTYPIAPVQYLDPRPAGDALTSVNWAPADGFFSSAHYRGAFAPGNNWLAGWTASTAFGLTPNETWTDLGLAKAGVTGDPVFSVTTSATAGAPTNLKLTNAMPNSSAILFLATSRLDLNIFGATLVPNILAPGSVSFVLGTNASGGFDLNLNWPAGMPSGTSLYFQCWVGDAAATNLISVSNAGVVTTP